MNEIYSADLTMYLACAQPRKQSFDHLDYLLNEFKRIGSFTSIMEESDFAFVVMSEKSDEFAQCLDEINSAMELNKYLCVLYEDQIDSIEYPASDATILVKLTTPEEYRDSVQAFNHYAQAILSYRESQKTFLKHLDNRQPDDVLDILVVLNDNLNTLSVATYETIQRMVGNESIPIFHDNQITRVTTKDEALRLFDFLKYAAPGAAFAQLKTSTKNDAVKFVEQIGHSQLNTILVQTFASVPQLDYSNQITTIQKLVSAKYVLSQVIDEQALSQFKELFRKIEKHEQIHHVERNAIDSSNPQYLDKSESVFHEIHGVPPVYIGDLKELVHLIRKAEYRKQGQDYFRAYDYLRDAQQIFERLLGEESNDITKRIELTALEHVDFMARLLSIDPAKSRNEFKRFRELNIPIHSEIYAHLSERFGIDDLHDRINRLLENPTQNLDQMTDTINYLQSAINRETSLRDQYIH